jgi:hypothetical protein
MKAITLAVTIAAISTTGAFAKGSHAVSGYVRKDGTYVAPHMATNPNSTTLDNWSTKPNVNPYTGEEGTKNPETKPAKPK